MKKLLFFIVIVVVPSVLLQAQHASDTVLKSAALEDCIQYALNHQPSIQQSLIDEAITENTIKNKLADWYPQINAGFNVQHYFQLPTSFIPDNSGAKIPIHSGL